jgi:hypothetical protein
MAVKENKDTCNLCKFFSFGERMGVCKRYPVVQNKSNDDWCGEWQPIKNQVIDSMVSGIEFKFVEPEKKRGRPKKS